MFKPFILAAALAATSLTTAQASTLKDVDLMFVIDRSGSMRLEGDTLADRIGEVMAGIAADSRIGSVQAGVISYLGAPTLVSAVTGDAAALETSIDGITYSGSTENGLNAMTQALPGGSLFTDIGWRNNTVRSFVLLTDENSDPAQGNDQAYIDFAATLNAAGYLNNVIVSDLTRKCAGLGGTSTTGGCEYINSTQPVNGAAFDLINFVENTDAFLSTFITTKIGEIVVTDPVDPNVVPLPATAWMLLAGLGGLGAMRRRKTKAAA